MSRSKRFLFLSVLFIILLSLSELACWGLSHAIFKVSQKRLVPPSMMYGFHPLFQNKKGINKGDTHFDPYIMYRPRANLKQTKNGLRWATDSDGFVLNDVKDRSRSLKQKNRYRIFVLGGSTVMGSGNESTLAYF